MGNRCYVNMFMGAEACVDMNGQVLRLSQRTGYPFDGGVELRLGIGSAAEFEIAIRIPGWSQGRPVPSDLYTYVETLDDGSNVSIAVNGELVSIEYDRGYAVIKRTWSDGDIVQIRCLMPIRKVTQREGTGGSRYVALERGPLLYCFEADDNEEDLLSATLPVDEPAYLSFDTELLGGLPVIDVKGLAGDEKRSSLMRAVPYFAHSNRSTKQMAVFIASQVADPAARKASWERGATDYKATQQERLERM
jgi:hypothetical protein